MTQSMTSNPSPILAISDSSLRASNLLEVHPFNQSRKRFLHDRTVYREKPLEYSKGKQIELRSLSNPISFRIPPLRILFSILLFIGTTSGVSWGQIDTLDVGKILEDLSIGNERDLVSHAGDYIELALLEQPRRYTRSHAPFVLRKFFRQYSIQECELEHNMTQGDEWWLTGYCGVRDADQILRFYLRFGGISPRYKLIAIQVIHS